MYHGIISVWKPRGMTSHDVVMKLRRILQMRKIGHTGTLDPEVDGVLVLCLGDATRLVEHLTKQSKAYQGEVCFGLATDTEDSQGQVIDSTPIEHPFEDEVIDQKLGEFLGEIEQKPPYYSAVKIKGRKLYEYARAGIEVERPSRKVQIYKLQRTGPSTYCPEKKTQSFPFEVSCSKGTYIRTLAVDIGKKMGVASHMSQLTRIASGSFTQTVSHSLEEIEKHVAAGNICQLLLPIEEALHDFPRINLEKNQLFAIQHGQVLEDDFFPTSINQPTALFYQDKVLAVYQAHPDKTKKIKPYLMFPNRINELKVEKQYESH